MPSAWARAGSTSTANSRGAPAVPFTGPNVAVWPSAVVPTRRYQYVWPASADRSSATVSSFACEIAASTVAHGPLSLADRSSSTDVNSDCVVS